MLRALGGARAVGVDPAAPAALYAEFAPGRAVLADLAREQRLVKSSTEINIVRKACQFADLVMDEMMGAVRVGASVRSVYERAQTLLDGMRSALPQGITSHCQIVPFTQSPPESGALPQRLDEPDQILPAGPVIVNAIVFWGGYAGEVERTVLLGESNASFIDLWTTATEAQAFALKQIRPGRSCAEAEAAMLRWFAERGLKDALLSRTGHGMGRQLHERPFTDEGSVDSYTPGSITSCEPGIYRPNIGGFRHSDTVLVLEQGVEILTKYPRTMHPRI